MIFDESHWLPCGSSGFFYTLDLPGTAIRCFGSSPSPTCVKFRLPCGFRLWNRTATTVMENPLLIPLIVTGVTAMIIGACYLLMLVLRENRDDRDQDDE